MSVRTETDPDRGLHAPSAPAFAYGACAVALAAAAVWAVLAVLGEATPGLGAASAQFLQDGVDMLLSAGFALTGAFALAQGAGRAPVGKLLLVTGCGYLVPHAAAAVAAAAETGPAVRTAIAVVALLGEMLLVFTLFALPLWLPSGRLPGRGRWCFVGPLLLAVIAAWSAFQQYDDTVTDAAWYGAANPLGHEPWTWVADHLDAGAVGLALDIGSPAVAAGTLAVMAVRWRSAPRSERPRAWLLVPYLVWLLAVYSGYYLGLTGDLVLGIGYAAAAVWPLSLGYALARDRSRELDPAAQRALALMVLTTGVVAAGCGLALALSLSLPGARAPGALVLACAALVLGVLLPSGARWAARAVDRFYYGERAQPYHVVRELADRLSRAVAPTDAPALLCATVVGTLGLAGARVEVATRGGPREAAVLGEAPGPGWMRFAIGYEGSEVGELLVAPRRQLRALDRQDHELLRFLADQAAPAIAALRLYQDLQDSRERIVLAREEARRRLRRDLHDGLGPALSGLRLQVDAARAGVPGGESVGRSLGLVSEGIAEAVTELRRITDGLVPTALERDGLGEALRRLAGELGAGGALRIAVRYEPDPLPELPAAVEVAVYRIGAEALNNVVRHAGARGAGLVVRAGEGEVTVEVCDDGRGVESGAGSKSGPREGGVGLRSMAERAEELGGVLCTSGGPGGRGTVVRAVLPLRASARE